MLVLSPCNDLAWKKTCCFASVIRVQPRYAVGNVFLDRGHPPRHFDHMCIMCHTKKDDMKFAASCVTEGEDGTNEGKRIFEQWLGMAH